MPADVAIPIAGFKDVYDVGAVEKALAELSPTANEALRNLYEKTASFLGYQRWSELLPDDRQTYFNRVIQYTSHSTLSNETVAEPTAPEKQTVKLLLDHLIKTYGYLQQQDVPNG